MRKRNSERASEQDIERRVFSYIHCMVAGNMSKVSGIYRYVNMEMCRYVGVMLYLFRDMAVDCSVISIVVMFHYYWCIRKP